MCALALLLSDQKGEVIKPFYAFRLRKLTDNNSSVFGVILHYCNITILSKHALYAITLLGSNRYHNIDSSTK